MRTNNLFRDYLAEEMPGHETPTTVWVTITPDVSRWHKPIVYNNDAVRRAFARLHEAIDSHFARRPWTDYGAQRGLEGLERAHFNDAVEQMTRATPWTRDECARALGRIMDAAARIDPDQLAQLNTQPTDPRDRALWHKQHRGTGPAPEPLRVRGRTNRYRERG